MRALPRVLYATCLCLSVVATRSFAALPDLSPTQLPADHEQAIGEVVVTARRREQPKLLHAGNIAHIDRVTLEQVQHQHIGELLDRVAGAWIVRGSGQEHQTSIRSPALTGGGACGNFLILEDGIPVRPPGFCNVNQFAEINAEQANAVEVIRGPGNALFGSNALHGIVNVLMPGPGESSNPNLALETGANDYYRFRTTVPFGIDAPWAASAIYADDGGFRDDSGYRQAKLHVKRRWLLGEGEFTVAFSASDLDQETAGFIYGQDAYEDSSITRGNPVPDAFRDVSSQRLYGIWTRSLAGFDLDIRPYVRHTDMRFMHHGLPGTPIEENGHVSAGMVSTAMFNRAGRMLVVGLDFEWSDIYLRQDQEGPADGPPARRAVRPQGKHYDYEVAAYSIAPFVQAEFQVRERVSLGAGLRVEYLHYDYDNRMLDGNTRDDGTACGFGGCLYTRPGDRTDHFTNVVPKLSASYRLNQDSVVFASASNGYRVPQALELYRLQNGQQLADLDSERITSFEAGWRTDGKGWYAEIVAYSMRKRDGVFRDAEGFNVSGARSRHRGLETSADWQMAPNWHLSVDVSYARHTYDFSFLEGRGERIFAGRDIDTAPRLLGNVDLLYEPSPALAFGLQWRSVGEYFLDAENRFQYPGHSFFNLRARLRVTPQLDLAFRLNNVTDEAYADRADYAAGSYRYLPGRGRELFAELRYSPRLDASTD